MYQCEFISLRVTLFTDTYAHSLIGLFVLWTVIFLGIWKKTQNKCLCIRPRFKYECQVLYNIYILVMHLYKNAIDVSAFAIQLMDKCQPIRWKFAFSIEIIDGAGRFQLWRNNLRLHFRCQSLLKLFEYYHRHTTAKYLRVRLDDRKTKKCKNGDFPLIFQQSS